MSTQMESSNSLENMNKFCHYHQIDEENFQRCCNPSCDISRDRIKKYQLLRSKEHKVLEKYENAMKIHDTIAKRRQSIDIGRHFDPLKATKSMDKLRRFSVPNKPKPKKSLSLQPLFFNRLETLTDDELDSINTPQSISPSNEHVNESYRHSNGNHLRVQNVPSNTNSLDRRKISVTPTPHSQRSPVLMKKLSRSMDNLIASENNKKNDRVMLKRNSRLSCCHVKTSRYLEVSKSLPLASHYRKNRVLPYHQRFLEAKRKFDARKSMLTSLDMDIHKVTLILRKMKSRSMPNLLDTSHIENKMLQRSATFDNTL